jgi:predicted PurR-regulated permease PerM
MADLTIPPDRPPVQVPPADTPGVQGLLTLAVAVVVVAGLYLGREVMIPIILAVLLSFLLAPLVNVHRRMHLGRVPSVLLAVVLALGVILTFAGVIGTQLAELAPDVPRYASAVQQKVDSAQQILFGRVVTIVRRLGRQLDNADTAKTSDASPSTPDASKNEQKAIPVEMHEPEPTTVQLAQRILAPIVAPLLSTAIVFIVAIFILLQREDLRDRLIRLFGSSDLHRTTVAMNDAARRLSKDAARHQRDVRCHRRYGPVLHRGAIAGAVGRAGDAATLCALHRGTARGHCAADACGRGRSWLVDGAVDGRALRHRRDDHGPGG